MEREELLKRYRYVLNENRHIADLKRQDGKGVLDTLIDMEEFFPEKAVKSDV